MMVFEFVLSWAASIATYLLISRHADRKQRSTALRRLHGKEAAPKGGNQRTEPLLMKMAGEMRGVMAMRLLEGLKLKQKTEQLLDTADLGWGAAGLTHRSVAGLLIGFFAVTLALRRVEPLWGLAGGALLAVLPFLYVRRKARARVHKFEEQFPDCLEFISRSMRAGHAFSVSLDMVHREFSEPLAGEFRRTFEEQNLGQPIEIVLKKLGRRIPSMDVNFFVSAVLLQKRTGGNLSELLDKLAHIIRERFKLRSRIKSISAQGVMSGRIIAAIPLCIGGMMFVINRPYAQFFIDDPMGRKLLAAALGLQLIGFLIIRKIVTIEV
jgi:tight adherence protein B